MAFSAWPTRSTSDKDEKCQHEHRTLACPSVKYECTTNLFNESANVTISREGLLALIRSGFFHDALFMTTKLLSSVGQGPAMIWSCRFQLMMVLRMYSQLLDELSQFGELDSHDLFTSDGQGSIVPFSLRLLHAEAPSFSQVPYSSIVRMHKLTEDTNKAIEIARQHFAATESQLGIWHERLEEAWMSKARVLFRLKEYSTAYEFYEWIMANSKSMERRSKVRKMLILMAMHIGDEQKLVGYMDELKRSGEIVGQDEAFPALKAVFDGDYKEALEHLRTHNTQNNAQGAVDVKFLNNESVCLLYSGDPVRCVQTLLSHQDVSVPAPLAMNMATVSDLVSTNSMALKQSFLERHRGGEQQQQCNTLFNPAEVMRMQQ